MCGTGEMSRLHGIIVACSRILRGERTLDEVDEGLKEEGRVGGAPAGLRVELHREERLARVHHPVLFGFVCVCV